MTKQTTIALRTAMRQIVDMAPSAPDLPTLPDRRSVPLPMLALASGFAAVLLFVGVGGAFLMQSADPDGESGGQVGAGFTESTPVVDAPIVVVYFADGLDEPPASAVESLRDRPEVMGLRIVDTAQAEAEIRDGLAALPESEYSADDPVEGISATVRVRVETDTDVQTISKFASELDDVVHVDAYFGSIDDYPQWNYEESVTVEDAVVTTTSTP